MKTNLFIILILSLAVFAAADNTLGEEQEYYYLDIIYTNDIHGGIMPTGAAFMNPEFPPPLGGGGSFANYVEQRRKAMDEKDGYTLILDAGDFFSGTPIGTKSGGLAVINFMNMLGYDAMVIGNHEFDLGYPALEKMIETAEFPVLGANIVDKETGKVPPNIEEYIIKEYDGLKVGIIGVGLTATPTMALPENMGNVEFLPEEEVLEELIPEVRPKCDILIVLTHMFLPYDPVEGWQEVKKRQGEGDSSVEGLAMHAANIFSDIDLMFTGHVHRGYYEPWEDPVHHTLILQTYGNGTSAGEILLKIDRESKTIAGYELPEERGSMVTLFADEFPPDNEVGEYIAKEQAIAEEGMDDPIGYTNVRLTRGFAAENTMGMLIVDAFRNYYGADFAFSNLGGVRAELPQGDITPRQLFKVMPFGNQLVKFKLKGKTIKRIVETKLLSDRSDRGILISGGKITYNKQLPKWNRITEFIINGEPLDPEKEYDVITTNYLAEGNSGMELLVNVPQERKTYTYDLDIQVVEEYIGKISPINMKPDNRLVRDDQSSKKPYLPQTTIQ